MIRGVQEALMWSIYNNNDYYYNKIKRTQQKIEALCFNRFFLHDHYSYAYTLAQLKLHTFCNMKYHFDALFLIQIYLCSKFCPLLETVGFRVLLGIS
jgi:hypothetical protein